MTWFSKIRASSIQSRKPAHLTSIPTFLPIFLITWWFNFASLNLWWSNSFLYAQPRPPKSISPGTKESQEFNEFWLYSRQYVQCKSLAKKPKNTTQRILPIWRWGKDIFLRLRWKDNIFLLLALWEAEATLKAYGGVKGEVYSFRSPYRGLQYA